MGAEHDSRLAGGDPVTRHLLVDRVPPTALLLSSIVSIQIGSAVAITLFPIYGPLGMLFLRMAIGGALLCVICRSQLAMAVRRAPLGILLLGLAMALQSSAFYEALSRIPLGITVSIEFLGPLGVALATSRRLADVLCILLAGAGIMLLAPSIGAGLDPIGVGFAVAAAAGWAAFILASRRLGRTVEGGVGMALAMSVSGLLLFPVAGISAVTALSEHPVTLLAVAAVALFSAAIPLLFEFVALRTMPARRYGILVSLEPVLATLVGMAILAEAIDVRSWIAIVMISAASVAEAAVGRTRR